MSALVDRRILRSLAWFGLLAALCVNPANSDPIGEPVAPSAADGSSSPSQTVGLEMLTDIGGIAAGPDRDEDIDRTEPASIPLGALDECARAGDCINAYLWTIYDRTRKIDTIRVSVPIRVVIKKKKKAVTVTRTTTKLVDEDFTWKDPKAAENFGMTVADYVIGGMDPDFRSKLYQLLRALDEAGFEPGITSGFRDDYRQAIASGTKAAADRSYHGGSRRGGYGHGLAVDIVSTKGETRAERWIASAALWKWIDANGEQFGIGRPYLDRDAPHIGPVDGEEYIRRRGTKRVALEAK